MLISVHYTRILSVWCGRSLTAKGQLITVNSSRKISSYCFRVFIVERNDIISADCLFSFAIETSFKRCFVFVFFERRTSLFLNVKTILHDGIQIFLSIKIFIWNTYRIQVHFPIGHLRIQSAAGVMSIGSDNRNPM